MPLILIHQTVISNAVHSQSIMLFGMQLSSPDLLLYMQKHVNTTDHIHTKTNKKPKQKDKASKQRSYEIKWTFHGFLIPNRSQKHSSITP